MLRSTSVTLLSLFFSSFAMNQGTGQVTEVAPVQQATHEVLRGETLWSLAERYLGNPYRWPLIFEANSAQIPNPNVLEPGQILVIPSLEGQGAPVQGAEVRGAEVKAMMVATGADVAARGEEWASAGDRAQPQDARGLANPCPGPGDRTQFFPGGVPGTQQCPFTRPAPGERSSFYDDPSTGSELRRMAARSVTPGTFQTQAVSTTAVPLGLVYGADWLVESGDEMESIGTIAGFEGVDSERTQRGAVRISEVLEISAAEGANLRVGDLLQSYRVLRKDRDLGTVLRPTGILTVSDVSETGVVAMVSAELWAIYLGDKVRRAPEYVPRLHAYPVPVQSNVSASVIGFPEDRVIQSFGAQAFIDVGAPEGVSVGDIFKGVVTHPGPLFGTESVRLQVILVQGPRSTARIVGVKHPVLGSGDLLRLVAKMQ